MLDIMNITFLDAGYSCIPTNNLYFGMQLSYLETVGAAEVCFKSGGDIITFYLGLNFSQGHTLLSSLLNIL